MKIKKIDTDYTMYTNATGEDAPILFRAGVTQEEATVFNDRIADLLSKQSLVDSDSARAMCAQLISRKKATAVKELYWNTRRAAVECLYAEEYKNLENKKIPASRRAEMQSLGLAFCRAPKNGYVSVTAAQIELLRECAYELPLHPQVKTLFDEALNIAEGSTDKNKVEFGAEENDESQTEQSEE